MANAFPEDAPKAGGTASKVLSFKDQGGAVAKGSISGQNIDSQESSNRQKPKPKSPKKIVRVSGAQLRWILGHLHSPEHMKKFIEQHIETLCWAQEMKNNLLDVLKKFAPPDTKFREDMGPETLMNILKDVMERYQRLTAMLDVTADKYELLEGTALKLKIEDSSKKIGDLLESYEAKMNQAEDNLNMLREVTAENWTIIDHLKNRVNQLSRALLCLEGRMPTQEEFVTELKEYLEQDIRLNSTLLDSCALQQELAEEKKKKHLLFRQICTLKEDSILDEGQKMRDIAELARDFQLEDGIKKEIVDRIKTLAVDPDMVHIAVENWMDTVRSAIAGKEGEIERLKKTLKDKEDEVADLRELNMKTNEEKRQYENTVMEVISECNQLLEVFNAKQQQLIDLDNGIDELDSKIRSRALSSTRYYDAFSTLDSTGQSYISSPTRYYDATSVLTESPESMAESFEKRTRSRSRSPHSSGYNNTSHKSTMHSPKFAGSSGYRAICDSIRQQFPIPGEVEASGSYSLSCDESPEKLRQKSPYRERTYFDDSNSMSIHSTPHSASPPYSLTPPSPFCMPSPLMQSVSEVGAPGTVMISGPSSKFIPRTAIVPPTKQKKVSNRFDEGESFNFHTTCETSIPCQQVTRVASYLSKSGYSGQMKDPLTIMYSSEITPAKYETPFISHSRFGYTDPTSKTLNMPPDLELFKQLTPSQEEQGISPDVVTYGTPPAVTPTTTRRHGLFTPKGIFRKKHFNVKRIFQPDYFDSPETSESPQYSPEDSQSPARPASFSPRYSDKSLSWKRQYSYPYDENIMNKQFQASPAQDGSFDATTSRAMNRTFGSSPQHAMNRTFDRSPASAMDRTFVASSPYATNKTFGASPACALNRTFDRSPASAMDRTFVASSPYAMDRTFNRSPTSARKRTFDASPTCAVNRTFDRSPAPAVDRTFDRSPALTVDRTFDRSPALTVDRTFDRSPALTVDRTFDRSPASSMDRKFAASSPYAMDRTFATSSPYAMDRTFARSPLSAMNRTFFPRTACATKRKFDRYPSLAMARTFNASSPSHRNRRFTATSPYTTDDSFDAFSSCALNRTFNKSLSSPLGRTFQLSPPPNTPPYDINRTFDASSQQPMNRPFDESSIHNLNTTFGVSPSCMMNRTINKSFSSPLGRTFQQSPSHYFNEPSV